MTERLTVGELGNVFGHPDEQPGSSEVVVAFHVVLDYQVAMQDHQVRLHLHRDLDLPLLQLPKHAVKIVRSFLLVFTELFLTVGEVIVVSSRFI